MSPGAHSIFKTEFLPENHQQIDAYFGSFFGLMRRSLVAGGSEFGLGMTLFSLAVSIRAASIIEIGRFKGFSTLSLASALKFIDIGWQEPAQHKQRPDMNYDQFERSQTRKLFSIDPFPTQEARDIINEAQLNQYVEFIDRPSESVQVQGSADLIFIDGDHSYQGCKRDVVQYTQSLRPGGYFILHDYFGWYDEQNQNNSPVKKVIDELVDEQIYQHILMDTGYQGFVIFRKSNPAID